MSLRSSINRNLGEIVELHEELLGDLHGIVPHSEYSQSDYVKPLKDFSGRGHQRWRSLDAVPENVDSLEWVHKVPGMTAEPATAAEVAKLFGKNVCIPLVLSR